MVRTVFVNELNRLRELLDIKGANDVASDTPIVAAQPADRSNSDLDDDHVLSTQSQATDTGASTAAQAPIAPPDENHPIGIQEDKLAVPTLPEDTRAPVEEEKPTVSAREENPIAADQRANELNTSHELLDIKGANVVASDIPKGVAQPTNRSDSNLDDGHVLSPQSRATDTGAPTAVQTPIATPDENHPIGIQEDKLAVPTLPQDTRASVQEEKPTVTPLEEKPIASGSKKSTKATPDRRSAAIKTPQRVKPRTQSPPKRNLRSRPQAPSKQNPSSPQYSFDPFGYQQPSQTSMVHTTNQQTRQISTPNANNYFGNQRAGQP